MVDFLSTFERETLREWGGEEHNRGMANINRERKTLNINMEWKWYVRKEGIEVMSPETGSPLVIFNRYRQNI